MVRVRAACHAAACVLRSVRSTGGANAKMMSCLQEVTQMAAVMRLFEREVADVERVLQCCSRAARACIRVKPANRAAYAREGRRVRECSLSGRVSSRPARSRASFDSVPAVLIGERRYTLRHQR